MALRPLTDVEIRDTLLAIDVCEEITVSTWEAEFLDSAVYNGKEWTVAQRATAAKIAERHRHQI